MENTRLLLKSMVRLKALRLNSDLKKDYDDYNHKFNKIMDVLDSNSLSIPKRLEDIIFDSGLPDGSRWFRNVQFNGDHENSKQSKRKIVNEKIDFLEYHRSNAHASLELLEKKAKKQNFEIVNVVECDACKKHSLMLDSVRGPKPKTTSLGLLEIFHFHLSSEFPVVGFTGVTRFLLIIDDYSKMMFIYTIQNKNEVMKILFKFLTYCSRFRENSIRKIITSDTEEFNSSHIQLFLRNRNIRHEKKGPNERNEFVDHYARSIQIMLKLFMYDASCLDHIDPSLWSEAIKAAVYVYNNLPSEELEWSSPSDIWLDKTLIVSNKLYTFGKWFMASFPNQTIKLKKCRFVGYHPHEDNFYRFYCPKDETIGFGNPAYELFEKNPNGRSKSEENGFDRNHHSDRHSLENHQHSKESPRRIHLDEEHSERKYSNRDHSNRDSNRDRTERKYSTENHSNRDRTERKYSTENHSNRDHRLDYYLDRRPRDDKDYTERKRISSSSTERNRR